MPAITPSVEFDVIAREWRAKWSGDNDKASLESAAQLLKEKLSDLKAVAGVKSVQRVVCGGCLDFKVITAVDADKFGDFESGGFCGEAAFLEKLKAIPGITAVETQTYTLMTM
eukprot:TRINITY_DN3241_c0_g1_i1.p2 TRINITY_DN3241_c0_g1~~TRINITY_DN3241_c0_g1_i1.p2  ORF type:complete len:113 (-),score=46.91 TRINITY_DN3241_c0_g1_i1:98-436(-)